MHKRFQTWPGQGRMRAAALTAGIVLLILGIASGDPVLVLGKAVTICLECMGIG